MWEVRNQLESALVRNQELEEEVRERERQQVEHNRGLQEEWTYELQRLHYRIAEMTRAHEADLLEMRRQTEAPAVRDEWPLKPSGNTKAPSLTSEGGGREATGWPHNSVTFYRKSPEG